MIQAGGEAFQQKIKQWTEDLLNHKAPTVVRGATLRLFLEVIKNSPVHSGNFVMAWQPHEGSTPPSSNSAESRLSKKAVGKAAAEAVKNAKRAEISSFFSQYRGNVLRVFTLSNTLPYAVRVEHGGWGSKDGEGKYTAPYKPVHKAMQRAYELFLIAVEDAKYEAAKHGRTL